MRLNLQVKAAVIRALILPVFTVFSMAIGLMFVADRFLHQALDRTIVDNARENAHQWVANTLEEHPELANVTVDRGLSEAIVVDIRKAALARNIFRFKLLDDNGMVLVVSDELQFRAEGPELGVAEVVSRVFETNISDATLHDGTSYLNRPDTYVEVYVQAQTSDGEPFGVIEVYYDITAFSKSFHGVFHNLTLVLIFGSAVAYTVPSLFYVFRRIKIQAQDEALVRLSKYDPLTNTLNRRAFSEQYNALAQKVDSRDAGVVYIDIDHFKQINDSLGHGFGDAFLTNFGEVLTAHLEDCAILSRFGGDEFIVLSPDATEETLLRLCDSIRDALSLPFELRGNTITPSVSIGAYLARCGETEETALHCADLALRRAKRDGRNQVVLYSVVFDHELERRRYVEAALRKALAGQGEFFLDFQPIFDEEIIRAAGFEALLRLRDEFGDLISPAEFIPIAEDTGLIVVIGLLVLTEALRVACSWHEDQFLAVNLSAIQLRDAMLTDELKLALDESGFEAHRLHLEVTESVLIEDEENVGKQLKALKSMGVSISLDDFGTGYSNLAYLSKFQFDLIKIDRSFVADLKEDPFRYQKLISTIIALGKNFDMKVVAEGLEEISQLSLLRELGCDLFQGFLLGRPMHEAKTRSFESDHTTNSQITYISTSGN